LENDKEGEIRMVGGYYTQYFSTLFKGIRMTSLKERIEVRRLVNNLKKADYVLYKSLIQHVEKDHKVTKAIKEEGVLLKELNKSSENAYSMIFNLSTEDLQLIETVEKILKELETFSREMPNNAQLRKVERDFAMAIFGALKKAENEEEEEYKQVMLVINEAENTDLKKFMSAVRLAFQKEDAQTILAKFAARSEIRRIKVDILKLQHIPVKIKALKQRFKKKGNKENIEKMVGEFNGTIQEIKKYCHDAFYELFLIKKRDLLWVLKILFDLSNLRINNIKWARNHLIPNSSALEKNKEIVKIQTEIGKHFHTIAQAFRIIVSKIKGMEKEAELDASRA
jgi:hypothetical protein